MRVTLGRVLSVSMAMVCGPLHECGLLGSDHEQDGRGLVRLCPQHMGREVQRIGAPLRIVQPDDGGPGRSPPVGPRRWRTRWTSTWRSRGPDRTTVAPDAMSASLAGWSSSASAGASRHDTGPCSEALGSDLELLAVETGNWRASR